MHRSFIAVAGILAIAVAAGAVTASASRTAVPSFELTAEGWFDGGEFTASGAFCPSGRIETVRYERAEPVQLLTCADGSGTATALVAGLEYWTSWAGTWRILGGTGAYEKLRGHGTLTWVETGDGDLVCDEFLGCDFVPNLRTFWTGVADLDDAPPALGIGSTHVSKLGPGGYSLELALELGDQFEAGPVAYVLRVTSGLRTLAWMSGTAETPNLELKVPIRPGERALSVRVHLTASDSLGNESSLKSSMIVLPR